MAQPVNNLVTHDHNTCQQARRAAAQRPDQPDIELEEEEDSDMATVANIPKGLSRAINNSIEKFDGSQNFQDWMVQFKIVCKDTERTTDADILNLLVLSLKDQANDVFLALNEEDRASLDTVTEALKDTFTASDAQLQKKKMDLYNTKQASGQTLREFALKKQKMARGLELTQKEILGIIEENARPNIRRHLKNNSFRTVQEMLKSKIMTKDFEEEIDSEIVWLLYRHVSACLWVDSIPICPLWNEMCFKFSDDYGRSDSAIDVTK